MKLAGAWLRPLEIQELRGTVPVAVFLAVTTEETALHESLSRRCPSHVSTLPNSFISCYFSRQWSTQVQISVAPLATCVTRGMVLFTPPSLLVSGIVPWQTVLFGLPLWVFPWSQRPFPPKLRKTKHCHATSKELMPVP